MLIYNPAFDLYHCVYRMLQLLHNLKTEYVEFDRLRIWDFYLAFPNEIEKIKFPVELNQIKGVFKKTENPYDEIIDPRRIFEKMKSYQETSLSYLASYDFIDTELFKENKISSLKKAIPESLKIKIENPPDRVGNIIKLLTGPFNDISLLGENGLKYRTGLIDFKYDGK